MNERKYLLLQAVQPAFYTFHQTGCSLFKATTYIQSMKQLSFVILIFLFGLSLPAQIKRSNFWPIGLNVALDFTSGTPTVVSSANQITEAGSSISDTLGNLLFYTDGVNVFDATHTVMLNGANIGGCASSSQGALIVPKPQSPNLYYLFLTSCYEYNFAYGAQYLVIDMSLNNGLGGVLTPVQTIGLGYAEELAATYHSNNCDVWIVFHERTNANYAAYLLTDTGLVTQPVVSTVGPTYLPVDNTYCRSMLKFNREGTLAAQTARSATGPQVHNFDRSTGVFTPFLSMPAKPQFYDPYAACFAPNDSLLYVEVRYYATNDTWSYILQYDLTYPTGQQAADSAVVVAIRQGSPEFGQMQLGPDEKIYFAQYSHSTLGAINNPNTKGMGCNPTFGAVTLTGGLSLYGMPNFPSQFIGAGPSVGCTAPVAITESISQTLTVYPNPSQGAVTFDFADFEGSECSLTLTDLMGRATRTFDQLSLPYRLERMDLPVGMYIYQLTSENKVIGKGKLKLE